MCGIHRDRKGQTPYAVAPDKESRNMFRKFMAEQPNKYDYAKAQVWYTQVTSSNDIITLSIYSKYFILSLLSSSLYLSI